MLWRCLGHRDGVILTGRSRRNSVRNSREPVGPTRYQGKGIGEISNCPVSAVVNNVIFDAVGVRIIDLFIMVEKVLSSFKDTME